MSKSSSHVLHDDPKENRKEICDILRSGKFEQCRNMLYKGNDSKNPEKVCIRGLISYHFLGDADPIWKDAEYIESRLGLSSNDMSMLIRDNNNGVSFPELADTLEKLPL